MAFSLHSVLERVDSLLEINARDLKSPENTVIQPKCLVRSTAKCSNRGVPG